MKTGSEDVLESLSLEVSDDESPDVSDGDEISVSLCEIVSEGVWSHEVMTKVITSARRRATLLFGLWLVNVSIFEKTGQDRIFACGLTGLGFCFFCFFFRFVVAGAVNFFAISALQADLL